MIPVPINQILLLFQKRSIEFACGNVQIDNKLYSSGKYDFPVIFCGQENSETNTHSYEKNNSEEHSSDKSIENGARGTVRDSSHSNRSNFNDLLPFLLQEIKSKHMQTPLVSIQIILENSIFSPDEIHCNFKPFRIYVEDKFIAVLIDFMIENLPSNIIYATNAPRERVVCESGQIILPRVITEQILTLVSEPLKFRWITIKPLSVLLSVHTCMRYGNIFFFLHLTLRYTLNDKIFSVTECISPWTTAHFILLSLRLKMCTLQQCEWVTTSECIMYQAQYSEQDGLLDHWRSLAGM